MTQTVVLRSITVLFAKCCVLVYSSWDVHAVYQASKDEPMQGQGPGPARVHALPKRAALRARECTASN